MFPSLPAGFVKELIEEGLLLLNEGIKQYPKFECQNPYEEKNSYFNSANNKGRIYLRNRGLEWVAEIYYEAMLAEILKYEKESNNHLNKGMILANLGIAQLRNGKIDEGIANLLFADQEDHLDGSSRDWDVLNTSLWGQFECPIIYFILSLVTPNPNATLGFDPSHTSILPGLFTDMDRLDRIFLEGTILAIYKNQVLHKKQPNISGLNAYTAGRLYSGLKDLCLLIEALLRKKQQIRTETELYVLLQNALRAVGFPYPQQSLQGSWKANNLYEFLSNIENISAKATNELRWAHCVHAVRNFTGHHFDPSDNSTSPSGKTFLEMYNDILGDVLSALLYFKHISQI